jgi:hypothetical protein
MRFARRGGCRMTDASGPAAATTLPHLQKTPHKHNTPPAEIQYSSRGLAPPRPPDLRPRTETKKCRSACNRQEKKADTPYTDHR